MRVFQVVLLLAFAALASQYTIAAVAIVPVIAILAIDYISTRD